MTIFRKNVCYFSPLLLMAVTAFNLQPRKSASFKTLSRETSLFSTAPGVDEFEKWWPQITSSSSSLPVRHTLFDDDQLRGLEYLGKAEDKIPIKVPQSAVLRTPFKEGEWDVNLSQMLIRECRLGGKSDIAGYTSLLMRGGLLDQLPPTAPDALRHWTPDQKSLLTSNPSGLKLLELQEKQQQKWYNKYRNIADPSITQEQFFWAMEAVHSRAFKGDFGSGKGNSIATVLFQLLAIVLGAKTVLDGGDDLIALGCGAVAILPVVISTLMMSDGDAVLLPLIDSANHLEEADSRIEFDPVGNDFLLTIGDKCLVKDDSGKTQMCISYGVKKDVELMLNYGFLRGVSGEGEDTRRKNMADEFLRRNP